MKRFIIIVIVQFVFCLTTIAEAIDLSKIPYNDLVDLSNSIQNEIEKRPEWPGVLVPAGIWTVGEDIPAGVYSIRLKNRGSKGHLSVWGSAVNDYQKNGGCIYPLVFGYEYDVFGKCELKSGYIVEAATDVIFAPPLTLRFR